LAIVVRIEVLFAAAEEFAFESFEDVAPASRIRFGGAAAAVVGLSGEAEFVALEASVAIAVEFPQGFGEGVPLRVGWGCGEEAEGSEQRGEGAQSRHGEMMAGAAAAASPRVRRD
jgi:hypothetical protein